MSLFQNKVKCYNCLKEISASNKFCNFCGARISRNQSPEIKENKWISKPDEFAAIIHANNLSGFFSKNILIEPGTKALIIKNNKCIGEKKSGNYTIETFLGNLFRLGSGRDISIVFVKEQPFPLEIQTDGIMTKDYFEIQVSSKFSVSIDSIEKFTKNMMGTKKVFLNTEVIHIVSPFIKQAFMETVRQYSVNELLAEADIRRKINDSMKEKLSETLTQYGLSFNDIKTIEFKHEDYNFFQKIRGEDELRLYKKKHSLDQKKKLFNLYSDEEFQSIKELEGKNELDNLKKNVEIDNEENEYYIRLRKIELQSKIRKALNSDKYDEIKNEQDMAEFLGKIDQENLIKQEEKDILIDEYNNRKSDRELARKFILDKLKIQRDSELVLLKFEYDHKIKMKKYELDKELASKVNTDENKNRLEKLEQQKKEKEYEYAQEYKALIERTKLSEIARIEKLKNREIESKIKEIDRNDALKDTEIKANQQEYERIQEQKYAELAIENLKKIQAIKEEKREKAHRREMEKNKR